MIASRDSLREFTRGIRSLAFTGSGSSEYVGDLRRVPFKTSWDRRRIRQWRRSFAGRCQGSARRPARTSGLLARSEIVPETFGAVRLLVDSVTSYKHLVVTCNSQGALARAWNGHKNVRVIALPPETNDESLVMTSSFTNLLWPRAFGNDRAAP